MRQKTRQCLLLALLASLCLCLSGCEDEDERVRQALIDMGYMVPTATPEPTASPTPEMEIHLTTPAPGEEAQAAPDHPGHAEPQPAAPGEVLQDIRDRLEEMGQFGGHGEVLQDIRDRLEEVEQSGGHGEVLQDIRDRLENGREQPSRDGAADEANGSNQDKLITPTNID